MKPPKQRKLFPAQPDGDLQPTPEIHSTSEASTIESFLTQVEGRHMDMIESVVMKAFESFHLSLHDEISSLRARLEKFEKEVNTKWEESVHTNDPKVGELEGKVDVMTKAIPGHPKKYQDEREARWCQQCGHNWNQGKYKEE